mmetsp:Transcript_16484/g.20886  ORF Transcript_16484/g.20886 Transcript_16484/m.20886 type:complete len:83 (-) Transcript_16484:107-355(-)
MSSVAAIDDKKIVIMGGDDRNRSLPCRIQLFNTQDSQIGTLLSYTDFHMVSLGQATFKQVSVCLLFLAGSTMLVISASMSTK